MELALATTFAAPPDKLPLPPALPKLALQAYRLATEKVSGAEHSLNCF